MPCTNPTPSRPASHPSRPVAQIDENSRESREGMALLAKLRRRAGQVDHYKVLNIGRSATEKEIKRAYHKLAVLYHPDKCVRRASRQSGARVRDVGCAALWSRDALG